MFALFFVLSVPQYKLAAARCCFISQTNMWSFSFTLMQNEPESENCTHQDANIIRSDVSLAERHYLYGVFCSSCV